MTARQSDDAWFGELYRSQHHRVRAYVRRRVADGDVDNVVAEVFATAWRRRDHRRRIDLPWLLRTAANLLLHQYRSAARYSRLLERAVALDRDSPDHADRVAERRDAHERVARALAAVSEVDREVLLLSVWDQLTAAEIGRVLSISAGAAWVRLHRATSRLAAAATAIDTRAPAAKEVS